MKRLFQIITINGKRLKFVETVEIVESRNKFTNTCTITMPNRLSERNKRITDTIVKGSEVIVNLGYYPNLSYEFQGYVSEVIPEKTAIIKCENESYNIKKKSIGKDIVLLQTNLVDLMIALIKATFNKKTVIFEEEFPGIFKYSGDEFFVYTTKSNIGDWAISSTSTIIDVLAELQDKFKIYSYFRFGFLVVGANADPTPKNTFIADFQRNVPEHESNFNFKEASADRIVVKVSSISREGVITEIYAYYDGTPAEIVYSGVEPTSGTVNEFNIGGQTNFSIDDLKNLARIRLEALSFTGVDGSITTYPPENSRCATHGDICRVIDRDIIEKQGDYAIVEVTKRFGVGIGYRQTLGLGISL